MPFLSCGLLVSVVYTNTLRVWILILKFSSIWISVRNSTSGPHEAGCTGAGQLGRQGPRDMGAGGEGEGRYGLARKAVNKDGLERKAVNKGSSSIGNLQSEISAMYPSRRKERKHITFTIA